MTTKRNAFDSVSRRMEQAETVDADRLEAALNLGRSEPAAPCPRTPKRSYTLRLDPASFPPANSG
jgi:hypothetical protein